MEMKPIETVCIFGAGFIGTLRMDNKVWEIKK
jgi:hypothetical protein